MRLSILTKIQLHFLLVANNYTRQQNGPEAGWDKVRGYDYRSIKVVKNLTDHKVQPVTNSHPIKQGVPGTPPGMGSPPPP